MMAVTGWRALLYKETLRFWKVGFQTVGAPVLTALLYLMVFGHVLEGRVGHAAPREILRAVLAVVQDFKFGHVVFWRGHGATMDVPIT